MKLKESQFQLRTRNKPILASLTCDTDTSLFAEGFVNASEEVIPFAAVCRLGAILVLKTDGWGFRTEESMPAKLDWRGSCARTICPTANAGINKQM
jgi:hypothetical protein